MSQPADFLAWVTDPQRTNDELFTVELLLERMRISPDWPFPGRHLDFEEKMKAAKARRFNPAYRPLFELNELEALQQRAATVIHFSAQGMSDRPLRDLTALRFFPALENLDITGVDLADLSPLGDLPNLKSLTLMESVEFGGAHCFDFALLGAKPALSRAWFSLRQPWPDLSALSGWTSLKNFNFHGNVLALCEVATLPAVEEVNIASWPGSTTPLRDLRVFPTMPRVRLLALGPTASLTGIERYATTLNLELTGDFTDLGPLAAMENITFLKLTGKHFTDLAPLARMPRLRELVLVRERPLDLSPLTDGSQLRRVAFERCATMRTELAALNAGLLPEADDFVAETPRPLGPLPFYLLPREDKAAQKDHTDSLAQVTAAREAFYQGDAALQRAEARSFLTQLFGELNQLLGYRWGYVALDFAQHAGRTQLSLKRYQDTTRIREIIQLLRELSARSRFPWVYDLAVEPHGDLSYEMEQLHELEEKARQPDGHWLAKYFEPESVLRENEEHERHEREKYEILEREHLYRLQQQQGETLDPDFPPPPDDDDEDEDDDLAENEEPLREPAGQGDDETPEGGVTLAPPPPAPPKTESLSEQLSYYLTVTENYLLVRDHWADRARYSLGESPVPYPRSPPPPDS